jgi:hypothetical protein
VEKVRAVNECKCAISSSQIWILLLAAVLGACEVYHDCVFLPRCHPYYDTSAPNAALLPHFHWTSFSVSLQANIALIVTGTSFSVTTTYHYLPEYRPNMHIFPKSSSVVQNPCEADRPSSDQNIFQHLYNSKFQYSTLFLMTPPLGSILVRSLTLPI